MFLPTEIFSLHYLPRAAELSPSRLMARFNRHRVGPMPALELGAQGAFRRMNFVCGGLDLRVEWEDTAPPPSDQRNSLADRALRARLRQSQTRLRLSVGAPAHVLGGAADDLAASAAATRQQLAIANRFNQAVAAELESLAIYWPLSDRLHQPEELTCPVRQPLPAALCFRAHWFAGANRLSMRRQFGLRAVGTEMVLGRTLILREGALDRQAARRLMERVIGECLTRQELPATDEPLELRGCPPVELELRQPSGTSPAGTLEMWVSEDALPNRTPVKGWRGVISPGRISAAAL